MIKPVAIRTILLTLVLVSACAPAVREKGIQRPLASLGSDCEVVFLEQGKDSRPRGTIVGSISVGDTGFSIDCDADRVTEILRERACTYGANAVFITRWKRPDIISTCHRADAELYSLRVPDWPKVKSSRSAIVAELDDRAEQGTINDIEGIWTDENVAYEIAIIEGAPDGASDYLAVVLEANESRWWQPMEIKAEIDKTAYPNVFTVKFFGDDRRPDTTTAQIDENGLLKISLTDTPTKRRDGSLWIKKHPPIASAAARGPSSKPPGMASLTSQGSCFFVSAEGHLVTNHHVVENHKTFEIVKADGRTFEAKLLGSSEATDLALLKITDGQTDYLSLSSPRSTSVGTEVFTLGYPISGLLGDEPKFTEGSISSLSGIGGETTFMQISVPTQPGNSGGPLVNFGGEVVGVVTASAAVVPFMKATGTLPQNINWAVKSEYARALFDAPPRLPPTKSRNAAIERARRAICQVRSTSH